MRLLPATSLNRNIEAFALDQSSDEQVIVVFDFAEGEFFFFEIARYDDIIPLTIDAGRVVGVGCAINGVHPCVALKHLVRRKGSAIADAELYRDVVREGVCNLLVGQAADDTDEVVRLGSGADATNSGSVERLPMGQIVVKGG